MATPTVRQPFAGVDRFQQEDGCKLPGWYRDVIKATIGQGKAAESFNGAVRDLPRAEKTKVAYWDDDAAEWRADDQHVALVNPAWLGDGLPADDPTRPDSAVWHIPTDRYTVVNPMEAYGPLGSVIRQYGLDKLGCVFGEIRQFREGGDVHMDILFDGLRVSDPDSSETPFVLGITTGYDFFGGRALYARPIAYDERTGTALRSIAPKRSRKHTGAAGASVAGWWKGILESLDDVTETLFGAIVDARSYTIRMEPLATNVQGFYEALGYPEYLAKRAAKRVGQTRKELSAWTLYYGMAETLTQDFTGTDTGALESHVSTANVLLFRPPKAEQRVVDARKDALKQQKTLTGEEEEQLATLVDAGENAKQSLSKFRSARRRLSDLMNEAEA